MATYIIGDIHGCLTTLKALLEKIHFDAAKDTLVFTGDLVNRGPDSLDTLRFIKALPNKQVILGNHDLHCLALSCKHNQFRYAHNIDAILTAKDHDDLIGWLRQQPLTYWLESAKILVVHAGIHPSWSIQQALDYGKEVSGILTNDQWQDNIAHLYGNLPNQWDDHLTDWDRLRMITNILTRMRFCDAKGHLDFEHTGPPGTQPDHLIPWFDMPVTQARDGVVAFGHWAALKGNLDKPGFLALDGGCVWDGDLIAYRVEDKTTIDQITCEDKT